MRTLNRRSVLVGGLTLLSTGASHSSTTWPKRNVFFLVGFGAGGVLDILVRILAEELRKDTSHAFLVENRPGASGMLAAATVARAEPDGHTLLAMSGTITIAPAILRDLQINVTRDLAPITLFASSPNLLIVGPDFPAKSIAAFLTLVRSKPMGEFAYATSGRGTTVHLMAGMLESAANISLRHIPFRSSADSIRAVVAGELPMAFSSVNSALPFIQSGQVRAIAVATEQRSSFVPSTETFAEAGLPNVKSDTWFGIAAGARLDAAMQETIYERCSAAMKMPGMRERLASLGTMPLDLGPVATKTLFDREVADFAKLAATMGLSNDQ